MMRKILTALSKYSAGEVIKKPVWVWQHSQNFPTPPRPVANEQVCDVTLKNGMIEMQRWGDAEMKLAVQSDKRSTTLRLFFSKEIEEIDGEIDEEEGLITNMPTSHGRVHFAHETCNEVGHAKDRNSISSFSVFETATAMTQLRFTGSPWTEEETRKHLESIVEFHRTITSSIDFSVQEKENQN